MPGSGDVYLAPQASSVAAHSRATGAARNVRARPHSHVSGLTDHVAAMLAGGDPG